MVQSFCCGAAVAGHCRVDIHFVEFVGGREYSVNDFPANHLTV